MKLEELKRGMLVTGVSPEGAVTLKHVESGGDGTVEVIFKEPRTKTATAYLCTTVSTESIPPEVTP